MTNHIVGIVQARIGGSRLPGKVLITIAGQTLLQHHVSRLRRVAALDEIVVAIPTGEANDPLWEHCVKSGYTVLRGPENDVLARYAEAVVKHKADVVVRTTADCPLIDPGVIAGAIKLYQTGGFDYVTNNLERTFPHGLDVEIFSAKALMESHVKSTDVFEREHVTEYIRRNQDRPYVLGNLRYPIEDVSERYAKILREARITVDYPEDLFVVKAIIEFWATETRFITTADIVWLLDKVPDIMALNAQRAKDHESLLSGAVEPISVEQRQAWDKRGES